MLINAGFSLFPALLSAVYYVIVSASRLENVPQPTELGSKVLSALLEFPNSEWINLGDARLLLLLIALIFLARAAYKYHKAGNEKEKEAELAMLTVSAVASFGILFTPFIVKTSFSILSAMEGAVRAKLIDLLTTLKDEVIFIVPMTALTILRYFFLVLLSILLPLALLLYIPLRTRSLGKIMLEQAFIWTIASEIALALLVIVDAFAAIPAPVEHIPTLYLALISAAIVVIAPPITLKILEVLEKILGLLWNAIIYEYKETYGKGAF